LHIIPWDSSPLALRLSSWGVEEIAIKGSGGRWVALRTHTLLVSKVPSAGINLEDISKAFVC